MIYCGLADGVEMHKTLASSDHNQVHFNINIKDNNENKQGIRRNFQMGNNNKIRECFGDLEWDDLLKDRSAIEVLFVFRVEPLKW